MVTLTVDYNHFGDSKAVVVLLRPALRSAVHVGDTVTVEGDGVDDRLASVESLSNDRREAELRFLDPLIRSPIRGLR
jgi:hypothetical protein